MIELRGVSRSYSGVPALTGVSLKIEAGEVVAIAGPSGSGKTTLLRLVAGLETPESGEILLDGNVASRPGYVLEPHRRSIGFAFQQPALWPHMTVAEILEFPVADWPGNERAARVAEVAALLGLEPLAKRRPAELSGGEARRVALGRAIARHPKRLLLDEPLVNLDCDSRDRALAHLLELASKLGSTVLYVTHDLSEAEQFPRLVQLGNGRVAGD